MLRQLLRTANIGQTFQRQFSNTQVKQQIKNHQPNNLERRFLVWTGKYKTVEEVPSLISSDVMERCRNRIRIRVANIMIALTIVGCGIMVYSGKQASKRGETITKQNMEWHKRYNEENKEPATTQK